MADAGVVDENVEPSAVGVYYASAAVEHRRLVRDIELHKLAADPASRSHPHACPVRFKIGHINNRTRSRERASDRFADARSGSRHKAFFPLDQT